MFTPSYYNITDKGIILNFLRAFPFASLVSIKDGLPFITHLPFIAEKNDEGFILYSHLAAFNPHAALLESGQISTVAFLGPHAFVSTSLYSRRESAPTWNYMAVHLTGKTQVYHDEKTKREVLEKMIALTDPSYQSQWESLPGSFLDPLMPQLTAFSVVPDKIEACFKLSQEKPERDKENIIAAMESSDDTNKKAVAHYMRQLLQHEKQ